MLWTPSAAWRANALPAVLGYAVAALVYLALLQISLSRRQKRLLLGLIVASAVIEALLALMQLWVFDADNRMEYPFTVARAYGNFQQTNLLGSFLATGFGIALYLLITTRHSWVRSVNALAMLLLLIIIIPVQSRVGWLGALTVTLLLLFHFRHHRQTPRIIVIGAPLVLLLIATWLTIVKSHHHESLPQSVTEMITPLKGKPALALVDKSTSNMLRWQMLKHSLQMVAEHPLKGWGMGGFEHAFTQYLIQHSPDGPLAGPTPTHPHNEILYLWIEGGIMALIGGMLLVLAWLRLAISGCRLRRHRAFPLWCLTLPIALHTLFEYPLYQSAAHGLVLLLLIRLTIAESVLKKVTLRPSVQIVGRSVTTFIASAIVVFAVTGLHTNNVLTRAERSGFRDTAEMHELINPYAQWDRYVYDSHMLDLKQFTLKQDYRYLAAFKIWADNYVTVHNDANIYYTLIRIADAQQSQIRKSQLIQRARQLFPADERFVEPSLISKG
ncbi:PglL family O-oligosaccharyltransferase [Pantoea sp. SOD02]|uniref:PglL family O-oligosaccharyltransferase n=1 Tax=Pantoea sp. SOD02 TaxID=2970818 RepID=UPI00215881F1|nr:O-antigen ligase family protein [Pantoea sp. SOD02]UVC29329.1 Wzy polymerase domain-containing protein [Pantoea sp. SOD02]